MSTTPILFQILNPIMKTILKSPFHKMMSGQIMILTFQGVKSGKTYTTPVSYSRENDNVTCFTHANWWKNFRNGADVKLRLQGQDLEGYAVAITDDLEQKIVGLQNHILAVPYDARFYGVTLDENSQPNMEQVIKAAGEAVMIQISLANSQ